MYQRKIKKKWERKKKLKNKRKTKNNPRNRPSRWTFRGVLKACFRDWNGLKESTAGIEQGEKGGRGMLVS